MKKFILAVWVMLCTMPSTSAYAADLPAEKGIERIKWAIMSCGHMPKIMIIGLSITAAIILVTVIIGITYSRRETNE